MIDNHVPYGAILSVKEWSKKVEKGQQLCKWDPYNAVILSEFDGTVVTFDAIEEGITCKEEFDEQTGHREKVITDTKDKTKNPAIVVTYKDGSKSYNIPVGAHLLLMKVTKSKLVSRLLRFLELWVNQEILQGVYHV